MSNYSRNAGLGLAESIRLNLALPTMGRLLVVCPAADANYDRLSQILTGDPEGNGRLFTTVAAAYAAAITDANDVIALAAGASFSTAMITITKNRLHFVGLDGGGRINSQGTKIVTPATDVAASVAVVYNTGIRNTFRNIKFVQNGTNAAQLYAFIDAGEGTLIENCNFSHDTLLSTAAVASFLSAGDTCNYKHCQIGTSTVYRTGNPSNAALVGSYGGAYARYTIFENCDFVVYSSQTASRLVGTTGAAHVIGWVSFKGCTFNGAKLSDGATAGALPAVGIVSALSSGYLLVDSNCSFFNVTAACSTHASILNAAGVAVAAAAGGLAIAGA